MPKTNENGSGEVFASMLMLVLLLVVALVTINFSMFFLNKISIQAVARDGARTVAIFGGAGNEYTQTRLEKAYGTSDDVATGLKKTLKNNPSLMNVRIDGVKCGPYKTDGVGQETSCTVDWTYFPIPGDPIAIATHVFDGPVHTKGTAQSEVRTDDSDMVRR